MRCQARVGPRGGPSVLRAGSRAYIFHRDAPAAGRADPHSARTPHKDAMASFILFIISSLLGMLEFAIIAAAIFSWLVAFDVINYRNNFVRQVGQFLDAVTRPVLRPVQRIIPAFGGVDISPIIVILIIEGIRRYLLPMAFAPLQQLIG